MTYDDEDILGKHLERVQENNKFWKFFVYDCYTLDILILFYDPEWLRLECELVDWQKGFRFPIRVRSYTQFLRVHIGAGTSRNAYPMNTEDSVSRVKAADTEGDLSISVDDKNS